jgi:hypothetical protein
MTAGELRSLLALSDIDDDFEVLTFCGDCPKSVEIVDATPNLRRIVRFTTTHEPAHRPAAVIQGRRPPDEDLHKALPLGTIWIYENQKYWLVVNGWEYLGEES